jgi:hypothetical protein
MGDTLVFLMVIAYLAALFGLAWVILRAASRYVMRKLGRVAVGSVSGLVGCLGSLIGLVALFFVI